MSIRGGPPAPAAPGAELSLHAAHLGLSASSARPVRASRRYRCLCTSPSCSGGTRKPWGSRGAALPPRRPPRLASPHLKQRVPRAQAQAARGESEGRPRQGPGGRRDGGERRVTPQAAAEDGQRHGPGWAAQAPAALPSGRGGDFRAGRRDGSGPGSAGSCGRLGEGERSRRLGPLSVSALGPQRCCREPLGTGPALRL